MTGLRKTLSETLAALGARRQKLGDVLDATKLVPEELVAVRPVGRMVLNRNPDNFFAETCRSGLPVVLMMEVSPSALMPKK